MHSTYLNKFLVLLKSLNELLLGVLKKAWFSFAGVGVKGQGRQGLGDLCNVSVPICIERHKELRDFVFLEAKITQTTRELRRRHTATARERERQSFQERHMCDDEARYPFDAL